MSTSTPHVTGRPGCRWWLPSISTFIWLAFFLATIFTNLRGLLIGADGDPCLHWRIGNWMIENRTVIRTEEFSHTRLHEQFISKEWLSEILFAIAGNALGWNGFIFIAGLLIATTVWLLHRQLLSEGNDLVLSTILVAVAALACGIHWLARPHLFTHLFTVVFCWQLRGFERDRVSAAQLFCRLLPLMTVWANLHGAFFTGGVLIGIHWLGTLFRLLFAPFDQQPQIRRKLVALTALLAMSGLAIMINPNGWRLPMHIISFLRSSFLSGFVQEFASPNFQSGEVLGFNLLLLLVGLLLLGVRPQLGPVDTLMIIVWGHFALHSARNVPIFAIVTAPILAEHFNEFLRKTRDSRLIARYRKLSTNVGEMDRVAGGCGIMVVSLATVLLVLAKPIVIGGAPLIHTDLPQHRFPVDAVKFLKDQPHAVSGEMFNDYVWGGYLMLVMPERKVFIDGRGDAYGEKIVRRLYTVDGLRPEWDEILRNHNVGWIILPPPRPLCSLLALHPDWQLIYSDKVALIYGRKKGAP